MKGITTIAAIPSGAGCLSALPAEVGEAKPAPEFVVYWLMDDHPTIYPGLPVIDADMLDTSE